MASRHSFPSYLDRNRLELIKVTVLIGLTVLAFFVTRSIAARTIEIGLADGAEWHAIGRAAIEEGDLDRAVDAFRRAVAKERENRTYGVALADALAMNEQPAAAERILLSLRETAPEDPDINLDLARLAAGRGDVEMALRYYQSALYAPPRREDDPLLIRLELSQMLLGYQETERALSELIAALDEIDDAPEKRVEVANLLLRAGDPQRAMEQFQAVLADDGDQPEAAAGAGTAAFALGDFAAAARFLEAAPDRPALVEMRQTAGFVLSNDPLAPRIRASERRRRLAENLAHVRMRVEACADTTGETPDEGAVALLDAITRIEDRLGARTNDQDVVDDGIDTIYQIEQFLLEPRCGPAQPLDRALVIIAERRLGGES